MNAQSLVKYFGADDNLFGFFNHQPIIGGQVRFTLNTVDNQTVDLFVGGNGGFNRGRIPCSAHADNAGFADFGYNFFRRSADFANDAGCAVYGRFPFVAFDPDGYHLFQIAEFAFYFLHFQDFAGNGGMNVGGDNAVGIGQQRADPHFVAFGYQNLCRAADMLFDRDVDGFGQSGVFNRPVRGNFVFIGVNAADGKSFFIAHFLPRLMFCRRCG